MRKSNREITDFNEIVDVLHRCDTVRLSMNMNGAPYTVPLSFGYDIIADKINIYIHGALKGLKAELLKSCANLCIEADLFHGYGETPQGITTYYESVIGFGTAKRLYEKDAENALRLILEHCGYKDYAFSEKSVLGTAVYKICITDITGKRNLA